ncbi:MAG: hypothetical protein L0H84_14445, partial [Pseudonocardia sp.]|nr:hypothetical protein [Pseudonocardia sp.]
MKASALCRHWPALAALAVAAAPYAGRMLRRRGEQRRGYDLRGDEDLRVDSTGFLRATESIAGAPISQGNDLELLINGDQIFPVL